MKKIKFVTTFSENGYHVYGQSWIESFLEFTKNYSNILAKVYINNMDITKLNYDSKVEIVDFDVAIPEHTNWLMFFQSNAHHGDWDKNLAIKFSFKSFVMMNELKLNNDSYVVWLDADSIFKSYDFDNFIEETLQGNAIACQKEAGSEHVESGIVIFDSAHPDTQVFLKRFESFYTDANEFNSFGQFFDGYAINRALANTQVPYTDLNLGYGIGGIQSDPNSTFMNPALKKRFHHNIGISGKRNYQNWKDYAKKDKFFQLIHGVNDLTLEEKLSEINNRIKNHLKNVRK